MKHTVSSRNSVYRVRRGIRILAFMALLTPTILCPFPASAARVGLSVDANTVVQSNFLGANAVYHGYSYMPDPDGRVYTEAQCKTEFDRVESMNLKIARTYYNYEYAWDGHSWNWDSEKMNAFYTWLREMKDRGVSVALQAAWWNPADVNGSVSWRPASPFVVTNASGIDWNATVQKYAAWVSESLHQMVEMRGFTNVQYLVMFTEPNNVTGTLPAGKDKNAAWLDCVAAVHNKLTADGRRSLVKLVGPNEGSTTTSAMLSWVVQNADSYIDIYSSHNYILNWSGFYDSYNDWYKWAKTGIGYANSKGKPYWFDEYGVANESLRWTDGKYGTQLALAQTAFMNAGAQSSLLWTLFDQQWPGSHNTNGDSFYDGVHKWGLAPTLMQASVPYKSYYAFSLISRYMGGPGTKVYAATGANGVHLSASKLPDGSWSILVVNSNNTASDISIGITAPLNKTFYRHLYNPSEVIPTAEAKIIGEDKVFTDVTTALDDTLPAFSVAVYTSLKDSGYEANTSNPSIAETSKPSVVSNAGTRSYNLPSLPAALSSGSINSSAAEMTPSSTDSKVQSAASGKGAIKQTTNWKPQSGSVLWVVLILFAAAVAGGVIYFLIRLKMARSR